MTKETENEKQLKTQRALTEIMQLLGLFSQEMSRTETNPEPLDPDISQDTSSSNYDPP